MDHLMLEAMEQHQRNWPETYEPVMMPFSLTLYRAHGILHGQATRVMAGFGLSPSEFDVLASLRRLPPPREQTPTQLQNSLLITSGGLTKILHQLEGRGLIYRSQVEKDRRVKPVRISEEGTVVIEKAIVEVIRQVGGWLQETLTEEEMVQSTAIMAKLTVRGGER
ncbi:MAG: MarR family transcriptional regulator [Magnetococcales bacterium]|nr:MarR family transcriptional regulator [Magnetococcales bacterium]NGZ28891.1 MarR family transcriptional regulator [Magnetococcales bacterium]